MTEILDSLLDVPLDDPAEDGDDRLVPGEEGARYDPDPGPRFALSLVGEPTHLVVPFRGPLKLGSRGAAVVAMKRALAHADCYAWEPNFRRAFTPLLGPRAVKGIQKFSRLAQGLDETKVYTREVHAKLARFYDPYSIEHLLPPPVSAADKKRNAFQAQLMYLYNRRWHVAYRQTRAWDGRKPPSSLDCSASGEWAAKWAGLRSLSGYSTWGYGNTDTQIAHLRARGGRRSSIREAEIGDPKFFGYGGDPSHVAYFIGRVDGRARVWSNGHYPLGIYDADYRHDGIDVYDLLAA